MRWALFTIVFSFLTIMKALGMPELPELYEETRSRGAADTGIPQFSRVASNLLWGEIDSRMRIARR